MNLELKEKICIMSEEMNTRVSYELTFLCDNETGMFTEAHRVSPRGYEPIYMPSMGRVLSLTREDFIKREGRNGS
jgi:hypothetical protein